MKSQILGLLIIFYLFKFYKSENQISIIIIGKTGKNYIFRNNIFPKRILKNGTDLANPNTYYLTNLEYKQYYNITMIWDKQLTTANYMFSELNIVQFDFSKFDTSKITNMEYMFAACQYLESLNLMILNYDNQQTWLPYHLLLMY